MKKKSQVKNQQNNQVKKINKKRNDQKISRVRYPSGKRGEKDENKSQNKG